MVKYLLCPGWIQSQTDGDWHYVKANQLITLYKVNPSECIVMPKNIAGYSPSDELIILSPKYNGQYIVPEKAPAHNNEYKEPEGVTCG